MMKWQCGVNATSVWYSCGAHMNQDEQRVTLCLQQLFEVLCYNQCLFGRVNLEGCTASKLEQSTLKVAVGARARLPFVLMPPAQLPQLPLAHLG